MNELIFESDYTDFKNYCFDANEKVPHGFKNCIYHTKEQMKKISSVCGMYEKYDNDKQMVVDYLLLKELKKHTILLYTDENGYKEGVASCVYIMHKGKKYILSAGHTFRKYDREKLRLFLSDTDAANLEDLYGFIHRPTGNEDDFQQLDYMCVFVDDALSEQMEKHDFFPFEIPDEILSANIKYPFFNFMYGFPAEKNMGNELMDLEEPTPYCLDVPFQNSLLNFSTLQEVAEKYKGVDFSVNNINSFSKRVYPAGHLDWENKIPNLEGMSGCGVWGVKSYPYSEYECFLAGIFIGYDKSLQNFISLKIQDAIDVIEKTKQLCPQCENTKGLLVTDKRTEKESCTMELQNV